MKNLSLHIKLGLLTTLLVVGLSGCSNRLGNMTITSTKNVNGLNLSQDLNNTVTGESCNNQLLFIPFGDFENRLQIATDNAIENGYKRGLKGDVLVNTKIDIERFSIGLYGSNCLKVKGNLVELQKSIK